MVLLPVAGILDCCAEQRYVWIIDSWFGRNNKNTSRKPELPEKACAGAQYHIKWGFEYQC